MMSNVIPVHNKILKVNYESGCNKKIKPMKIVAVGSQSCGKSSVLESISERDYLPRGDGLITKCPIVNQFVCADTPRPYVVFDHKPDEKFYDFDKVREEINDRSSELTKDDQIITTEELKLTFYSKDVVDLTLIDLPGLIQNVDHDRPQELQTKLQDLIVSYIKNSNVIILAISSATEDIENSVSIKLAKEYDPEGKRTIGVITKVDLMNEGTNCVKTLQGEKFKLKHGFVAVKCRSLNDIKNKLSIRDLMREEENFFRNKENGYSEIAHQQGIRFLREKISELLKNHLLKYLPKIQKDIKANFELKTAQLRNLPTQFEVKESERESYIDERIFEYIKCINEVMNGDSIKSTTGCIQGIATIKILIDESFWPAMDNIDPLANLSNDDIRIAIRNCLGVDGRFIVPYKVARMIIKEQISFLQTHCNEFCNQVFKKMQKLIELENDHKIKRFPILMENIIKVMNNILEINKQKADNIIDEILAAEASYIDDNVVGAELRSFPKSVNIPEDPMDENQSNLKIVKELITMHFTVIKNQLKNIIPKLVFNHLISKTKDMMSAKLFRMKYEQIDLSRFLEENSNTKEIRDKLKKEVDSLDSCLRIIDGLKQNTDTNDGSDQEQMRERKRKHRSKRIAEVVEEESKQS